MRGLVPAGAGVACVLALGEAAARATALEREPAPHQSLKRLFIERKAATLVFDRAIPSQAQILKSAFYLIGTAGPYACRVEILDTQKPMASLLARIKKAA